MMNLLINTLTLYCTTTALSNNFINAHIHGHFHDDVTDHAQHEHMHQNERRTDATPINIGGITYSSQKAFIESGKRCGAKDPTAKEVDEANKVVAKWMTDKNNNGKSQAIVVDTYFHVITAQLGTVGAISDDVLEDQLTVLTESYSEYGFSFTLQGITRTDNDDWYYAGIFSEEERVMKTALREGDSSTLNVYFSAADGFLGFATLPVWYEGDPIQDGVVVQGDSVPGGSATPYDEGKTLVHEVGHWFGLYHTFQFTVRTSLGLFLAQIGLKNACDGTGDEVRDTPRQKSFTSGCPDGKDTCPFRAGEDPIHNYMDYSDDVCYTEFTSGQADRMLAMWNEYRAV